MAESNYVNNALDRLDAQADDIYDMDSSTVKCVNGIREELIKCGMSFEDSDLFMVYANVTIRVELSPTQELRLIKIAKKSARNFYKSLHVMNFNDHAIALMGRRFKLSIKEE